ncbi:MAG TPA: response regulator [Nitrospiria bacterium]|jgi:two-component system response regulator PilR (NtrC family)
MGSGTNHKVPMRILVVEDDSEMRSLLTDELSEEGYEIIQAKDGAEAALMVAHGTFDLVITDMKMPKMGGLELLPVVKEASPDVPVIVITAFGDWQTSVEAMERGSFRYMTKPFKMQELKETVKKALEKRLC